VQNGSSDAITPPPADNDLSALAVQSENHTLPTRRRAQPRKKRPVHSPLAKCRRPDDHLFRSAIEQLPRSPHAANAAPRANPRPARPVRPFTNRTDQPRVPAAPHRRVQIDHVHQRVGSEPLGRADHVVNRQEPPPAAFELHHAPVLKIDARNQHPAPSSATIRTVTPRPARKRLSPAIGTRFS
jgi:hypothetical protein